MTSALNRSPSKSLDARVKASTTRCEAGRADGKMPGMDQNNTVLRQALQHVGEELGLSQQVLVQAVGETSSFFDPARKTAFIAPRIYQRIGLMLRLHHSLSSLVGNNVKHMRGWIGTSNRHTGGIPANQLKNLDQLERLVGYLESFDR